MAKIEKSLPAWATALIVIFGVIVFIAMIGAVITITMSALEKKHTVWLPLYNVETIMAHQPGAFTFLVKKPESDTLDKIFFNIGRGSESDNYSYILDVPADKKNWLNFKFVVSDTGTVNLQSLERCEKLEIHIHSGKDIVGGGWNFGKFGSGQTKVIN